jgi:hypothetical protein
MNALQAAVEEAKKDQAKHDKEYNATLVRISNLIIAIGKEEQRTPAKGMGGNAKY